MLVIPAIDLKDGRCVRLRQGDLKQETVILKIPLPWRCTGKSSALSGSCISSIERRGRWLPRNSLNIENILR